jgi:hypothetical protein
VPAGRITDRFGTRRSALVGLTGMGAGSALLSALPTHLGIAGYVVPVVVVTAGYALFQTANNTAVMAAVRADQRGVVAGMLGLSRNLGLVTGASVLGAVFVRGSGAADIMTASPAAVAAGMRLAFAVTAILIVVALSIAVRTGAPRLLGMAMLVLLARGSSASGQTSVPGSVLPTPADPYPLAAAGWGPTAGKGLLVSRWAEDWTGVRAAAAAPPLKAMPLGGAASPTLSVEARLRHDTYADAQLTRGNDYRQALFRGTLGADLRLDPRLRVYGEIGTGHVEGRRRVAPANFQNAASLQQLFVDACGRQTAVTSTPAGSTRWAPWCATRCLPATRPLRLRTSARTFGSTWRPPGRSCRRRSATGPWFRSSSRRPCRGCSRSRRSERARAADCGTAAGRAAGVKVPRSSGSWARCARSKCARSKCARSKPAGGVRATSASARPCTTGRPREARGAAARSLPRTRPPPP